MKRRYIQFAGREYEMMNFNEMAMQPNISSDVRFYTVGELSELLGWSKHTVQKMFNDPLFPSADFGRNKVVEAHALIEYFSRKHVRDEEKYWRQ